MELLHTHLTLLLFVGIFTSACCQDSYWSNFIGRVPEGVAGVDYPDLTSVPKRTSFTCRDRKPGFYADPETRCQAWHWCDTFLVKHSFLCANMTLFNQKIRGCDWWYNVDCGQAVSQYANNDELYRLDTEGPEEREQERTRRNRKQGVPPVATPPSNDLGAEQSVNGFTVTNAVSQQPEADLDFSRSFSQTPDVGLNSDDSLFFSASTAAPFTEAPLFDTSSTTRPPTTVRQIFVRPNTGGFKINIANAIPIVFPPPQSKALPSSTTTTRSTSVDLTTRTVPVTQPPTTVRQIFVRPNTGGFKINIANAIPIVFPPPPPKALPSSTTRGTPVDSSVALAAELTTVGGFEIQRNQVTVPISKEKPISTSVGPSNGLTKPRRRLRIRTHPTTKVAPSTLPTTSFDSEPSVAPPSETPIAPSAFPTFPFDNQPSAVSPSFSPVQPATTTTRVAPTAFPSFPFAGQPFAAPRGSTAVKLDNFFAPNAATAAPSTQQDQKFSRFPEFPPFPRTTSTQREIPISATTRPASISATSRPFFATSPTERADPPTNPFNFGIPFGARIGPGEALDQASTVRRNDVFSPDPTTGVAAEFQSETTVAGLRKRKFVEIGKTFPPFSVSSVLSPKFTKVTNPSTQLVVDLSTATAPTNDDSSATFDPDEKPTPKPKKLRRKITSGIQWPSTTIPVTTFRPRVTELIIDQVLTNSTATDAVVLLDDISLA